MSYEQRDNSGSLFKNDRKESEKHPDYTGTAKVQGREFYMSAWLKEGKSRRKYMSFSFKPKLASDNGSPPTGGQNDARPAAHDEFNDDIPF